MVKRRSYKAAIKKLRPFVKGAAAGTVTAAVFTVIGAFLFNIADAPSGADSVMAYVSLGASAVVCGMFFGGGRGKNGFAWGTLARSCNVRPLLCRHTYIRRIYRDGISA